MAPAAARPARTAARPLSALRNEPAGQGSLGDALALVDGLAIQRSLVVVVSDFRGPLDWRRPLLRVAGRHPTIAIEIRDPREQELADVGELRLVDPETGRHLRVDTERRRPARRASQRPHAMNGPGSCGCSPRRACATWRCPRKATGFARWQRF